MKGKTALTLASTIALLLVFLAPVASAHEGEEGLPARTLIEQAIVLLRSQPEEMEAIEDKIHDAIEAEDVEGVDLELVAAAESELGLGRSHAAQDLLEVAIGAAPHQVVESPNPGPGLPAGGATEAAPSPVFHEQALEGGDQGVDGAPILLGLAVILGLVGLLMTRRVR